MAKSSKERRGNRKSGCSGTSKRTYNVAVISTFFLVIYSVLQISDPSVEGQMPVSISLTHQNPGDSFPIRFILFLGIEGTGHHFWQDLIKESPIYGRVKEYGLHPHFTKRLTQNLYRHKESRWKGLWSSPCKWKDSDPAPNITSIHNDLVETLIAMRDQVISHRTENSIEEVMPVTFPVNFLAAGDEFGVVSYPTFLRPCRALQYPNLDVWYKACDLAGVPCDHIYIYRDPYSVIKSTVDNRNINKDKLEAIHLYTTQLQILHTQLQLFPSRLVGCWKYEDALSPQQWTQEINPILMFPDEAALGRTIQKIFRPRPMLTDLNRQQIVPAEFSLYMESFSMIHKAVVQSCKTLKK